MEDSTFSLETRDRKMPHPLKSVYYVGDDGVEIDIQKGGVAGKVFGWILFILILIPVCYFGGRFLYRKHQTHRYAHASNNAIYNLFGSRSLFHDFHFCDSVLFCYVFA